MNLEDKLEEIYGRKALLSESKDYKRISDMVEKASKGGDFKSKLLTLAKAMAHSITDAAKAWRRGLAAEDENYHDVAAIFFDRAEEIMKTKKVARELFRIAKIIQTNILVSDFVGLRKSLDSLTSEMRQRFGISSNVLSLFNSVRRDLDMLIESVQEKERSMPLVGDILAHFDGLSTDFIKDVLWEGRKLGSWIIVDKFGQKKMVIRDSHFDEGSHAGWREIR
jgi:hypothetical protein